MLSLLLKKAFKGQTDEWKHGCGTPKWRSGRVFGPGPKDKDYRMERIGEVRGRDDVPRFSGNES